MAISQAMCTSFKKELLEGVHNFKNSGGSTFQLDNGIFKLVTAAGRLSPVLPKGFTEAKILEGAEIPKRLGGGLGKNMKFILRLMGKVAKIFPGIGVGLAAAEFSSIAQDDELSLPQKRNRILGILGGLPGSVLGALLGGAVGGLAGPGLGNFVGALIGGGAGFFAGDQIAQALAQFALGEEVTAFDRLVVDPVTRLPRNLNKILSGSGESQDLPSSGESFLNVTQGGLNIGSGFATAAEGNAAIFGNLLAGPGNGAEVFTPNNTSLMLERSNGGAGGLTVKDTSLSGQMGNIITQFNNSNVNASTAKTISNKSVSSNGNATIDKINNLVNM